MVLWDRGVVKSDEVDFGKRCQDPNNPVDCSVSLEIDCQNLDSLTGSILSPEFPEKVTNTTRFGKVYSFLCIIA